MTTDEIKVGDKIEIEAKMFGVVTYRIHVNLIRKDTIHGPYKTFVNGDWEPIHEAGLFIKKNILSVKLIDSL